MFGVGTVLAIGKVGESDRTLKIEMKTPRGLRRWQRNCKVGLRSRPFLVCVRAIEIATRQTMRGTPQNHREPRDFGFRKQPSQGPIVGGPFLVLFPADGRTFFDG